MAADDTCVGGLPGYDGVRRAGFMENVLTAYLKSLWQRRKRRNNIGCRQGKKGWTEAVSERVAALSSGKCTQRGRHTVARGEKVGRTQEALTAPCVLGKRGERY